MISIIYWIILIIVSLVTQSTTVFCIGAVIWIVFMVLRFMIRNGVFGDFDAGFLDGLGSDSDAGGGGCGSSCGGGCGGD